jgi:8-oxo-dGTP diphosphatase
MQMGLFVWLLSQPRTGCESKANHQFSIARTRAEACFEHAAAEKGKARCLGGATTKRYNGTMSDTLSGSKIILVHQNKILAFLRDDKPEISFPGKWDLPGGGIEDDEDLLACAYRELDEEFGLRDVSLELIDVVPSNVIDGKLMGRVYGQLSKHDIASIKFGSEGQKYGLFTVDEIQKLDFVPHLRDYIVANRSKLIR